MNIDVDNVDTTQPQIPDIFYSFISYHTKQKHIQLMCSFGKPLTGAGGTKFYTGNKDDTPWNRDLLWKVFVDTEAEVQKRPTDKREGCIGIRRTHMGVTGTLIPESMYAVLLERQRKEAAMGSMDSARPSARSSRKGTGRSTSRSTARTARTNASGRSTGRSSKKGSRSQRTSRTVRDLKDTLVGEVRRRQEAENQMQSLKDEMAEMRKEISKMAKK